MILRGQKNIFFLTRLSRIKKDFTDFTEEFDLFFYIKEKRGIFKGTDFFSKGGFL